MYLLQCYVFAVPVCVTQVPLLLLRKSRENFSTEIMKKLSKFQYWKKKAFL